MNNQEAWDNYKDYTRDITLLTRKLAFAGVAVVWVLKTDTAGITTLGLYSLGLIVLFFFLDILQYTIAAISWYRWINSQEEINHSLTGEIEGDYRPPASLDKPIFRLFCSKVVILLGGFVFLVSDVIIRIV